MSLHPLHVFKRYSVVIHIIHVLVHSSWILRAIVLLTHGVVGVHIIRSPVMLLIIVAICTVRSVHRMELGQLGIVVVGASRSKVDTSTYLHASSFAFSSEYSVKITTHVVGL